MVKRKGTSIGEDEDLAPHYARLLGRHVPDPHVGWSMADHMRTELTLDALRAALGHRKPSEEGSSSRAEISRARWMRRPRAQRAVRRGRRRQRRRPRGRIRGVVTATSLRIIVDAAQVDYSGWEKGALAIAPGCREFVSAVLQREASGPSGAASPPPVTF